MKTLSNKVALITGSARGLGQAISERYASLGAHIVLNYSRDRKSAENVADNLRAKGTEVIAIQSDVSKTSDLEHLFAEAKKHFGKIDIVVANAGIEMIDVPVTEFTEAQFDSLFSINTKGAYFTMQQAAKHIADNGRIIYVSSSTTAFPFAGVSIYGGSKTAPGYLVEVLAKEIGHRGVTVNSIVPFAVEQAGIFTESSAYSKVKQQLRDANPMGRMATVEDVANVAEFLAGELSSFISGQHILVNGGAAM